MRQAKVFKLEGSTTCFMAAQETRVIMWKSMEGQNDRVCSAMMPVRELSAWRTESKLLLPRSQTVRWMHTNSQDCYLGCYQEIKVEEGDEEDLINCCCPYGIVKVFVYTFCIMFLVMCGCTLRSIIYIYIYLILIISGKMTGLTKRADVMQFLKWSHQSLQLITENALV